MKRGAIEHPKLRRLMRELGCEKLLAVGILESIWHFAARYTPRGDLGRYTDHEIADAIGYGGDPAGLVSALVVSEWADASEEHRVVIHGWFEHCDDSVHATLARATQTFASGELPKLTRLSKQERERISLQFRAHEKRTASARHAHGMRTKSAQPSQAKPSQAKPSQAKPLQEEETLPAFAGAAGDGVGDASQPGNTARPPEPAIASTPDTKPRAVAKASWLAPYDEPWRERFGMPLPVQKSLRPLADVRRAHGDESVLPVWRYYVANDDPQYTSAARFRDKFALWRERATGTPHWSGRSIAPSRDGMTAAEKTASASRQMLADAAAEEEAERRASRERAIA